jgi:hypothetical protein
VWNQVSNGQNHSPALRNATVGRALRTPFPGPLAREAAAADTRFAQDENTHGLFPGGGATIRFVLDRITNNSCAQQVLLRLQTYSLCRKAIPITSHINRKIHHASA